MIAKIRIVRCSFKNQWFNNSVFFCIPPSVASLRDWSRNKGWSAGSLVTRLGVKSVWGVSQILHTIIRLVPVYYWIFLVIFSSCESNPFLQANTVSLFHMITKAPLSSHLAQLDAVETKAFKIIGFSHDEAEFMGLSLSHRRQVSGLSVFYHLFSGLAPLCSFHSLSPPGSCRAHTVHHQLPSGETTKVQDHCSPPLFRSSLSLLV